MLRRLASTLRHERMDFLDELLDYHRIDAVEFLHEPQARFD
jgi:hypothetical protein